MAYLLLFITSATPVKAAAGINSQLSFEGKLVKTDGTNINSGTSAYNMEFKIYQDGTNTGSGSTLKWTEDWLVGGSGGVSITDGTFQVNLGAHNPFASQVDWNQDTLWLSMQIGNTSSCTISTDFHTDCGGDGEMSPYIRLTSVPYAIQAQTANTLSGLVAGNFVQLAQGLQTDTSTTNPSIAVNKNNSSGTPNILQLQKSSSNVLVLDNNGFLTLTPAASLTSGQSHITESFTNASSSGGTVNGLNQTVTVSNTSSASTTNGQAIALTDATTLANTNTGVSVTVTDNGASGAKTDTGIAVTTAGTNASQKQYALDAAANHGVAVRGASTGAGGNITCGPTTAALSIGVCGSTTLASSSGYGGYFAATGNGGTAVFATNGTSTSNILQLQDGTATAANVVTIADEGAATFQNRTNSTTAFQVQNAIGSSALVVDTTPLNTLLTNSSFEGTDISSWVYSGAGGGSVARVTTGTTIPYQGSASLSVTSGTTATANDGVKYTVGTTLTSSTNYTISFYIKLASGSFSTLAVTYSPDGGTHTATCTTLLSATVTTTSWARYACFVNSTQTVNPASNAYFLIRNGDTTTRTFYIDAVQLQSGVAYTPYKEASISLNGVVSSPVTVQNAVNSTTSFQVANASGSNILGVDTVNGSVAITGRSSSTTALVVTGASNATIAAAAPLALSVTGGTGGNGSGSGVFGGTGGGITLTAGTGGTSTSSGGVGSFAGTGGDVTIIGGGGGSDAVGLNGPGSGGNVVIKAGLNGDATPATPFSGQIKLGSDGNGTLAIGVGTTLSPVVDPQGDVFTVSNSSYARNIAVFKANASAIVTIGSTGSTSFTPTGSNVGTIIRQTSGTATSGNIFDVQGANGTSHFLQVTETAANAGSISLTSLGSNSLTLDAGGGTLLLGSNTTTLQKAGSLTIDLASNATNTLTVSNSNGSNVASIAATGDIGVGSGRVFKVGATSGSSISACGSGQYVASYASSGGIITAGSCNNVSSQTTLQNAYDNSGSPATITTSSSSKGLLIKAGSTFDSTALFQVQSSSSSNLFTADSLNGRIGVNVNFIAMGTAFGTVSVADGGAGSLTSGSQYYYTVTAIDSAGGETTSSSEGTLGTGHTALTVSWTAISQAYGYKIYRSTVSGSEVYLTTVLTNTFTDTGAISAGTAVAPTTNTAYITTNNSNSSLYQAVGGNGTPSGQLYVSGAVPTTLTGSVGTGLSFPVSVYVQGRYAYVANNTNNKLSIMDISNPAAPTSVGSSTSGLSGPTSVYVQGRYAYVTSGSGNKLSMFDISNPASPSAVANGSTTAGLSNPQSVYVQGRYAYVANYNSNQLTIIDVSNPGALFVVGSIATGLNHAYYIYVQGRYAYVASNGNGTLAIFDVSNPAAPSSAGTVTTGLTSPQGVFVQGRYAYVVSVSKLSVLDVSNPAAPVLAGSSTAGLSNPQSVYVQGRYAYVANNGNSKLSVFDVSNPTAPTLVGSTTSGINTAYSVFVQGRYAYVASASNNQLLSFDVGGTYSQQLEAGGIETGTLQTNADATINGDLATEGLQVGASAQISGNLGVGGGAALTGSTVLRGGNNQLGAPSGTPTVTPTLGTATSYSYVVTAVNGYGGETLPSATGTTAAGAATLDATHFNTIGWSTVTGAAAYKIYRTASGGTPSSTGYIGTSSTTSFVDNGITASGAAPTIDTTGQLTVQGASLFKFTTDSATAFQIQNSSSLGLLTADSVNNLIQVGSATSHASNPVVLVLDDYNNATDPTGTQAINGAMYYNASTGKFRCYENGAWTNCIALGRSVSLPYPDGTLGTSVAWTNMPAAVTEFAGTTTRRIELDLTGLTHWKMSMDQSAVAVSGALLGIQYSSDGGTTWKAIDSDTTNAQSTTTDALATTNIFTISAQGSINANAQTTVQIRVVGSAGNGTADPAFLNGHLSFYP